MNIFSYIIGGILVSASFIAGLLLIFFPPKFLNALYGMSTKSTRKSKKAWDLGHKVCGISLVVYAFFSILAYVLMLLLARDFFDNYNFLRIVFGLLYALVGVLIAWAIVELELARLGKRTKKEKPQKAKAPAELPAEKATENSAEISAEVSVETAAELPAETSAESPAEVAVEVAVETPAVVITETVTEVPTESVAETPTETLIDNSAESSDKNKA